MSGRKQGCVWLCFDKIKIVGKAGCWVTCKKCGKEMQGLVARLLKMIQIIKMDSNI